MADVIINDNKKYFSGGAMQANDIGGRRAVQALSEDWVEMDNGIFLYTSATRIAIDNAVIEDARLFFQKGDRLRILQTTIKYFYVVNVGTNYIDITGGTDYTFANAAITRIAFSRLITPFGFPSVFNYNPDFRAGAFLAQTPSAFNHVFWLNGSICYVDLHFEGDTLSSGVFSINCDLPINFEVTDDTPMYPCFAINDFNLITASAKILETVDYDVEISPLNDTGSISWTASTNGVGVDATFYYLID